MEQVTSPIAHITQTKWNCCSTKDQTNDIRPAEGVCGSENSLSSRQIVVGYSSFFYISLANRCGLSIQLLWNLFMSAPEVKDGLTKLGFSY
jgi:hypothetical protein